MAIVTCADCGADLDAVPAGPCPACGSSTGRRNARTESPTAALTISRGQVTAIVKDAVAEFANLTPEQQRTALEQARRLAAPQPVTRERTVTLHTLVASAGQVEALAAGDACAAELIRLDETVADVMHRAPALARLLSARNIALATLCDAWRYPWTRKVQVLKRQQVEAA